MSEPQTPLIRHIASTPSPEAPPPNNNEALYKDKTLECLKKNTNQIFSEYGDHRTQVDARGETPYGSRAKPDPNEVSLASCTGETPSPVMYDRANALRIELLKTLEEQGYNKFVNLYQAKVKEFDDRFLNSLGFKTKIPTHESYKTKEGDIDQVYTIDALSGTDAELLTFLFGVQQNVVEKETGTGTPLAASGKHTSSRSWQGGRLAEKQKILGLEDVKDAIQIPLRNDDGTIIGEEKIINDIRRHNMEASKEHRRLGIHLTAHSKTGARIMGDVAQVSTEMKNALIVVDAAQMRMSPGEIQDAVKNGCMVIVTGSKFPGGPLFSCKVLMNEARMQDIVSYVRTYGFPEGFKDYFSSYDFERILHNTKYKNHPPEIPNIPALLKWAAVIPTIEDYYSLDQDRMNKLIGYTMNTARQWLSQDKNNENGLHPVHSSRDVYMSLHKLTKAEIKAPEINPIISYKITRGKGTYLNKDQLKMMYWLLNHDLSLVEWDEKNTSDSLDKILFAKYHLGQPVQEGKEPACLRIAPGMEWWINLYNDSLANDLDLNLGFMQSGQLPSIVFEKMLPIRDSIAKTRFILKHWDQAVKAYEEMNGKQV